MLITFSVTAAVLAVLYLAIIIGNKKAVRSNYDFSTGVTKALCVVVHAIFCVSFSVIAAEIILCFFWNDKTALWGMYGLFLFFAVIGLLGLFDVYFDYEAICGNVVYVHRFFRVKKICVDDIRRIDWRGSLVWFYGKGDKSLFFADSLSGIRQLARMIDERKSDEAKKAREESAAEEDIILAKIGREYRASYKKRKKKTVISFFIGGAAFLAAIVSLLVFVRAGAAYTVVLGLLSAGVLTICFFIVLSGMKKELYGDDVSLGNKHKYDNKKVKGASKNKFTAICVVCGVFMFFGAVLTLPLWLTLGEEPNYDEYTHVTGTLEYCREKGGRYRHIAIGLYGVPTEYRLDSIYLDEFDYSFFREAKVGDTVTIYIDNGEDRESYSRDSDRKVFNHFYYLATDDKEYFTYDDYVKSRERNDLVGFVIGGVGVALFVASAVAIPISYCVCKKRRRGEEIEIYK